MRLGKYRTIGLRDIVADIITEAMPHSTDEEKVVTDSFTGSKDFDRMLDDIISEVDKHVSYNLETFSKEVTK